jgi:hypothetical protein
LVERTTISTINIAKLNKEAEETGIHTTQSSAIGFVIPDESEEQYDDEDI